MVTFVVISIFVYIVVVVFTALVRTEQHGADDAEALRYAILWPLYLVRGTFRFVVNAGKEFIES